MAIIITARIVGTFFATLRVGSRIRVFAGGDSETREQTVPNFYERVNAQRAQHGRARELDHDRHREKRLNRVKKKNKYLTHFF